MQESRAQTNSLHVISSPASMRMAVSDEVQNFYFSISNFHSLDFSNLEF